MTPRIGIHWNAKATGVLTSLPLTPHIRVGVTAVRSLNSTKVWWTTGMIVVYVVSRAATEVKATRSGSILADVVVGFVITAGNLIVENKIQVTQNASHVGM